MEAEASGPDMHAVLPVVQTFAEHGVGLHPLKLHNIDR